MTIWVVETDMYTTVPRVSQYAGLAVLPKGVRVKKYGHPKYIPKAVGREFFTDEAVMRRHCMGWLRRKLELLEAQARDVRAWLGGNTFPTLELTIAVQRAEPMPPLTDKLRLKDGDPLSYLKDD